MISFNLDFELFNEPFGVPYMLDFELFNDSHGVPYALDFVLLGLNDMILF